MKSADTIDDAPPRAALEKFGVIEADTFCTGCHYNLHGQTVTIDDRLKLPVCRCPECGRYHAAGTGVTASSIWVRRFAVVLLGTWAFIVAGSVLGIGGVMAMISSPSVVSYTKGHYFDANGNMAVQPASFQRNFQGVRYAYTLTPWNRRIPPLEYGSGIGVMTLLSVGSLVTGLIAGILCVTFFWHWPRRRYWLAVLFPLLPFALVYSIILNNNEFDFIHLGCLERTLTQAGFAAAGILIGIVIGRPVARGVLRAVVPPKPRQALAFLWRVDGKALPA